MRVFELTYTTVSRTQAKAEHHATVHHTALLALDNQKGGLLKHWGNVPHQIALPGEDIALGTKFTLTLAQSANQIATLPQQRAAPPT